MGKGIERESRRGVERLSRSTAQRAVYLEEQTNNRAATRQKLTLSAAVTLTVACGVFLRAICKENPEQCRGIEGLFPSQLRALQPVFRQMAPMADAVGKGLLVGYRRAEPAILASLRSAEAILDDMRPTLGQGVDSVKNLAKDLKAWQVVCLGLLLLYGAMVIVLIGMGIDPIHQKKKKAKAKTS